MKIKNKEILIPVLVVIFGIINIVGLIFIGVYQTSNDIPVSDEDITLRHLKMEGLDNLDMDFIKQAVEVRIEKERVAKVKAEEDAVLKRAKEQKEHEEYVVKFEADKKKWYEDNPPVKELFDSGKRDLEYTIQYLRDNWYRGDCALAWIQDIVCWEIGGGELVFPTNRPKSY